MYAVTAHDGTKIRWCIAAFGHPAITNLVTAV